MNTLIAEPLAKQIRFDADTMWVWLADGRQLGVPLAYFPRLFRAKPKQREKYIISGGGADFIGMTLMRTSPCLTC